MALGRLVDVAFSETMLRRSLGEYISHTTIVFIELVYDRELRVIAVLLKKETYPLRYLRPDKDGAIDMV